MGLIICLWTSVTSVVLFGGLRIFKQLRASEDAETKGLDFDHHRGYTGILRYPEELAATRTIGFESCNADMDDTDTDDKVCYTDNANDVNNTQYVEESNDKHDGK